MIEDQVETSDRCSMWRISVLAGCGEASWLERLQFAVHAWRCPQCRQRRKSASRVSGLLSSTFAVAASASGRSIPVRRVFLVTLWASLAVLALSSGYQVAFADDSDLASSLQEHECEPTSKGPAVRPECEDDDAVAKSK